MASVDIKTEQGEAGGRSMEIVIAICMISVNAILCAIYANTTDTFLITTSILVAAMILRMKNEKVVYRRPVQPQHRNGKTSVVRK